jgi:hypothetical protein
VNPEKVGKAFGRHVNDSTTGVVGAMDAFEIMKQHLEKVSFFGPSGLALVLILAVDLLLTLVHSLQELRGPLWRYFGAIAGVRISDVLGFSLFFLFLTALLWTVGFAGIAGYLPIYRRVPDCSATAAVGGLIGARLSDGLFSHVRLHYQGYRPNPGLSSTPYYFAEAVILAVLFLPGLQICPLAAAIGFVIAVLFFYLILPLLRCLRGIPPFRRDPPWRPGEPMPPWARW